RVVAFRRVLFRSHTHTHTHTTHTHSLPIHTHTHTHTHYPYTLSPHTHKHTHTVLLRERIRDSTALSTSLPLTSEEKKGSPLENYTLLQLFDWRPKDVQKITYLDRSCDCFFLFS